MDNSAAFHASLQNDALEQLVLNPTASHRWHGFCRRIQCRPIAGGARKRATTVRLAINRARPFNA
jgi:hypothetical protein